MRMSGELLYDVNEMVIALVGIGLLLLTIEIGYRLGDKVPPGLTDSAKSPGARYLRSDVWSPCASARIHRRAVVAGRECGAER